MRSCAPLMIRLRVMGSIWARAGTARESTSAPATTKVTSRETSLALMVVPLYAGAGSKDQAKVGSRAFRRRGEPRGPAGSAGVPSAGGQGPAPRAVQADASGATPPVDPAPRRTKLAQPDLHVPFQSV